VYENGQIKEEINYKDGEGNIALEWCYDMGKRG